MRITRPLLSELLVLLEKVFLWDLEIVLILRCLVCLEPRSVVFVLTYHGAPF